MNFPKEKIIDTIYWRVDVGRFTQGGKKLRKFYFFMSEEISPPKFLPEDLTQRREGRKEKRE